MYESYVDRVIDDFAAQGRMFTAYDVSREAQKLMADDGLAFIRHNEMKNYVHSACEDRLPDDWGRTPISLPNIQIQPFLYHRHSDDPASYGTSASIPTISANFPSQPPAPKPNPSNPIPTRKPLKWPKISVAPHDGRLNLPRFLLVSIGKRPEDSVYLRFDPSDRKMILTSSDVPGSTKFNVSASGRVRITRGWREANKIEESSFILSVESDRVIIEPDSGNN